MYESFYGFRQKPFALTPDPKFLYWTKEHRAALALMEYALANEAGFCVLTGEVGCGKTLLVRHALDRLGDSVTVGLIDNTSPNFERLLPWVCRSLGLEFHDRDDAALYEQFIEFLLREYAAGRRVVLIVDEAQNLDERMLEELRVLSNINSGKDLLLQTILVGQPQLKDLLARPGLTQLAQRVSAEYHLGRLTERDARRYVWHRLRVAGGPVSVFTPHAIRAAHAASGGVPRLINQLCDLALVFGYAERREMISSGLMRQAVKERTAGGVFPGAAPQVLSPRLLVG